MPAPASASWRKVSPLEACSAGVICRLSPCGPRSGQWLSDTGCAKPSRLCCAKWPTWVGLPWAWRYAGLASTRKLWWPSGRACSVESRSAPIRMATSVSCSSRSITRSLVLSSSSICGNCCRKAGTSGTMTCSMYGMAALTRRRPAGCWRRRAICSSASSTDARMARARCRKLLPSSVSTSRRVVRLSSVVSSFSSSRPKARLMPDTVCPSCSAAAVMEPLSTTVRNARSSSNVVFIVEFYSNINGVEQAFSAKVKR